MVKKNEFIWSMAASVCASALSAVLLLCVARINGESMAGLFSIAFATATVLNSIADFGMRVYHVTDTDRQYSFGVYLSARWLVAVTMLISGFVFVLVSGYSFEKAFLCLALVFFRFIDGLSETYQGEFQLNGRLDLGGKSVCYRTAGAILVFLMINLLTKSLILSAAALALTNLTLFLCYDIRLIRSFTTEKRSFHFYSVFTVIKDCFPLFFSTFLNNYIINAPKYAIDHSNLLSYEAQAHFNILYLPAFTINLLSIFILKPMLRTLGILWNQKDYKSFLNLVIKMTSIIFAVTIVVEAVCYGVGIQLLSVLFHTDLSSYRAELLMLVLAGCFSALAVVFFYLLTTMRAQGKSGIAYLSAAVTGLILPDYLVARFRLTGAAVSGILMLLLLCIILFVIFLFEWKKKDARAQSKLSHNSRQS